MLNLLPRDTVFFDLFEKLSDHAVSTANHLKAMAYEFPTNADSHAQRIRQEEHDADKLAHEALNRLDSTFITPFDREDIHALVGELDNIIDAVDALAKRFNLYHVKEMAPEFKKQADNLVSATVALRDAVHRLRKSSKLQDMQDKLIELHRWENQGDDTNHAAMSRLFEGGVEPLDVIKWKNIFDLIEDAIDGCEDAGNTLERIVLKNG
jgi:predicted phosphate transport protein (TIGR00153 family)